MKYTYIIIAFFLTTGLFGQVLPELCHDEDPVIIDTNDPTIKVTETFIHQPDFPPPPPPPPPVENRIIFWVHGLGGDTGSWAVAADEVRDNHDVASLLPTYSEFSLDVAGGELHDNQLVPMGIPSMIANNVEDPMTNYIIAHSQGGLVSRATDRFYIDKGYGDDDRMFGGIATFGSPHGGAQIINNMPLIQDFAASSLKDLKEGPVLEKLETLPWYFDIIIPEEKVLTTLDKLSDFVGEKVLPFALSDFQAGITDDYAVGAPALVDLNSTASTIPRAAFHGVEDDPVVWRTMYSLQNNPNDVAAYGADDDQESVDFANENTLSWEMKYLAYDQLADEISNSGCAWWQWIICWPCCVVEEIFDLWGGVFNLDEVFGLGDEEARAISRAYYKGWQWWLNADENYKILIGAIDYVPSGTEYLCDCVEEDWNGYPIEYWTEIVSDPDGCDYGGPIDCEITEITSFSPTEYESDGVVVASSAMAYPGADVGPDNAMIGSNHQQMRNDSNLGTKLQELFDGDHGEYFITE